MKREYSERFIVLHGCFDAHRESPRTLWAKRTSVKSLLGSDVMLVSSMERPADSAVSRSHSLHLLIFLEVANESALAAASKGCYGI